MKPRKYFDSIRQCAAITGISEDELKDAKDAGCPAFIHSRVRCAELDAWFKKRRGKRRLKTTAHRLHRENLRNTELELKISRQQSQLLESAKLSPLLGSVFAEIVSQFRALPARIARKLQNQPATEVEKKLADAIDVIFGELNNCEYLDEANRESKTRLA